MFKSSLVENITFSKYHLLLKRSLGFHITEQFSTLLNNWTSIFNKNSFGAKIQMWDIHGAFQTLCSRNQSLSLSRDSLNCKIQFCLHKMVFYVYCLPKSQGKLLSYLDSQNLMDFLYKLTLLRSNFCLQNSCPLC